MMGFGQMRSEYSGNERTSCGRKKPCFLMTMICQDRKTRSMLGITLCFCELYWQDIGIVSGLLQVLYKMFYVHL
jgi:hypothetical protein